MTAAFVVGLLMAGGVYLVFQAGLVRVTIGFVLIGHALNSLLVAAGGMGFRAVSFIGTSSPDEAADPLPQAFALTAIVITFGITVYLFGMARSGADEIPADDDVSEEEQKS
ncbi:sodium:proton antiporter [Phytoactinopolyspora mesophila]|uniref:Cation:proton antiporter n=1 Tax=Phytoactinopolyspora mesophila TaxID=2650750 RepID=A0A7K3MAV5_9ACTN|nr:NADH-quinone oxidoreductase subunit K [Phytoactinopolyspora mesophila]NDL60445.1 cation:proton antiporter [Phytoactinopolyspora mesophila]